MRRIGNTNHNPMLFHCGGAGNVQSTYRVSQSASTSTFTKLTTNLPAPTTGTGGTGGAWSNDGNFLAITMSASQYLWIYQRDGDRFTNISSKLSAQPFTSGAAYGLSWSPDNKYLTVTGTAAPYMVTYRHNSADNTFTIIGAGFTAVSGATNSCAWNSQGTSIALGLGASPWINVYNFNKATETFTKLTNPASASGTGYSCAWSPDGLKLALGQNASPWIRVWDRSGDTFTVETAPATTPGTVCFAQFTPDGTQLLTASQTSPYFRPYTVGTTTLTYAAATLTGGNPTSVTVGGVNISVDGKYIAIGCLSTPYMTIYMKTGANTYTKLAYAAAGGAPSGAPVWWPTSSTSNF